MGFERSKKIVLTESVGSFEPFSRALEAPLRCEECGVRACGSRESVFGFRGARAAGAHWLLFQLQFWDQGAQAPASINSIPHAL